MPASTGDTCTFGCSVFGVIMGHGVGGIDEQNSEECSKFSTRVPNLVHVITAVDLYVLDHVMKKNGLFFFACRLQGVRACRSCDML